MKNFVEELVLRYPVLALNKSCIGNAFDLLKESYERGGKLLIAGNGGSAADAEHIVGELMKGFLLPRGIDKELNHSLKAIDEVKGMELAQRLQKGLPAIALGNHSSLNTAFSNDVDGTMCFAQQVLNYGQEKDVFLGISTSGNSSNIIYACITAKAKGMKVIGLTGMGGGRLGELADVLIAVDEKATYKVQELHLPVYHCLCMMLEDYFWGQ